MEIEPENSPWSKLQKAGDMTFRGAYKAVHRYCAPTTGVLQICRRNCNRDTEESDGHGGHLAQGRSDGGGTDNTEECTPNQRGLGNCEYGIMVHESRAGLGTGPPLSNPAWKETERASHEDCKVASKAMVGRKGMYLCRGGQPGGDCKACRERVQRTSSP
jgi:hypothetical protein